jgi:hypothetical protein
LQDLKKPVAGVILRTVSKWAKIGNLAEDIATGERKLIARVQPRVG